MNVFMDNLLCARHLLDFLVYVSSDLLQLLDRFAFMEVKLKDFLKTKNTVQQSSII